MIFMCDKKCQTGIFGQRRRHQTKTALSILKANKWSILYQGLSENKKEAFRAPYLEKTAETTGVIRSTVACIRREKSERGRFVIPDGSEEAVI